ncbi:hypothetical protein DY000_02021508 [Brassica cretica]|uniref:Uncharacterized protein n=1 Tax=Brassica cretica TaxID=69181 RepID=A0ABQ7EDD7_BRACR|nr:hypothetical protein DY000_02021508 [Brassica cretica]
MKFQRSSMDVGVVPDLEITQGSKGSLGTRGLRLGSERWALNPEVSGPGGSPLDPEIAFGTRRWRGDPEVEGEPEGSPLDPGIMTGAWRRYENPEILH